MAATRCVPCWQRTAASAMLRSAFFVAGMKWAVPFPIYRAALRPASSLTINASEPDHNELASLQHEAPPMAILAAAVPALRVTDGDTAHGPARRRGIEPAGALDGKDGYQGRRHGRKPKT